MPSDDCLLLKNIGQIKITFLQFLKFIPFFQQIGDVCSFVVIVSDTSVCQIRVDFVDTQMLPPNLGECNQQYLTIKGNIWPLGVDRFCGNNIDGQHFYVEIDPSSNGYVTAYLNTRTFICPLAELTSVQIKP
jgi:hypothetical protein